MFGLLAKVVKTITLTKVFLWALAGIVAVMAYTIYENRADLFKDATSLGGSAPVAPINMVGATFRVSENTKQKVREFVSGDANFVAFGITAADIRLNQRITIFFSSEELPNGAPVVTRSFERLPLFTNDDENNRQMIKMINGEFHCVPYASTQLSRTRPDLNQGVTTVCRASLPPYYGSFAGFITVYAKSDVGVDQQVQMKNSLEAFATEIYFKDVVPTTRKAE